MATNDWHVDVLHVQTLGLSHKGVGAHNVQGAHTNDLLGVVHTEALEGLGRDGHSRVDWVGDDGDDSLRGILAHSLNQGLHDASVGVEQVISGHPRLAWDTSGNDDEVSALEASSKLGITGVGAYLDRGVAVAEISSNASHIGNIIQAQLGHELIHLQQQRQGLADATSSTQQCHLASLHGDSPAAALAPGNSPWARPHRRSELGGACKRALGQHLPV
mmetsp:Transcript_15307/g.33140  ORF Transcript_15307/g.33140 Transcript_15307/m.33140 type:complete len:218 (-) Transcript_15307:241-894(-)